MRRRVWMAATAAALCAVAVASGIATGATSGGLGVVSFSATYSGKATVKVADDVADISAQGTGTGTVIGASAISGKGKGDTTKQPCVPFTGTGEMSANNGSATLQFTVPAGSSACGDEPGKIFSVSGRANVTGGTGALAGATGSLKMTGVYDRGAGTFQIKFSGQLTTSGGGGTVAPAKTVLRISGGLKNQLRFSKKALTAKAGLVTIIMKNVSGAPHNVAIRNGTTAKSKLIAKGKVVKKGKTSVVKATLKKGKYRFACTVPGHEAAGMWGILTVK